MTPDAVEAHFPELFEKAKKCTAGKQDPFDFVLLALLKSRDASLHRCQKLAHLLFYVRHFPHLFQDLSFININDDNKNLETLKIAAQRVVDLDAKEEYRRFKEQF